jgi:hypothetical protein
MSFRCKHHPGRIAVFDYNGIHYCQKCKDGYTAAVASVNVHVEPKDCFVTYEGGDRWYSFSRDGWTGCAHWVAHQKKIQVGYRCLKGFCVRVTEMAAYLRGTGQEITILEDVKVQDVWVAQNEKHTGIVWRIDPEADPQKPNMKKRIVIRHDSSGQHKVVENELEWLITKGKHGPGQGRFYRKA